ncbi:MAG: very short patch repair endonuclease, partial [Candidatus Colwellbacteria bacterium]|nr:very short patch repair endonuclease [Candidatus Colwellbacteria bacterium]
SQRRKNMQNIRSTGTKIELFVARELRRRGIYFSRNVKSIIGKPDFVFRKNKIAVFIDSDFWHQHPARFIMPKSNRKYWKEKIARNKRRDKEVNAELKKNGWKIVRIWEYDIRQKSARSLGKILKKLKNKNYERKSSIMS